MVWAATMAYLPDVTLLQPHKYHTVRPISERQSQQDFSVSEQHFLAAESEQKNGLLKNFLARGIINATVTESDNKIYESIGLVQHIDSGSCKSPSK